MNFFLDRSYFVPLTLLMCLILGSWTALARAQVQVPNSEMPQGENITSNFNVTADDGTYSKDAQGKPFWRSHLRKTSCFSTAKGLYSIAGDFSFCTKIWDAPSEVRATWVKNRPVGPCSTTTVIVSTVDGNMHQLKFYRSSLKTFDEVRLISDKIIPSVPTSNGISIMAGDDLYAVSGSLVYAMRDTTTWQIDTVGLGSAYPSYPSAIVLDSSQHVYLATDKGIYTQAIKETSWHLLAGSPHYVNYFYRSVSDNLFAVISRILEKSTDYGVTWSLDTIGLRYAEIKEIDEDTAGVLFAISSGKSISSGPDHVWMQEPGKPWVVIDQGLGQVAFDYTVHSLIGITADSVGIHVGTRFGIFFKPYSSPQWISVNAGIPPENVYSFYRFSSGRKLVSTTLGVFTKEPADTIWIKRFPVSSYLSNVKVFADNTGKLYATDIAHSSSSTYGELEIWVSSDQAMTWVSDTIGMGEFTNAIEFVDERGTEHLAKPASGHPQFYAKPTGGTWSGDSSGYRPINGDGAFIFATDRHGSIYLALNNRLLKRPIDGGTWTEVNCSPLGGVPYSFTATRDGKLVAGNSTAVGYYDGTSWTVMPNPPGLSNPSGYPQSVDSSGRIWVLYGNKANYNYTPYGVYWTSDLGAHWTKAADGSVNFSSLVSFGDTTYGLNSGKGLWYFVPGSSGGVQSDNDRGVAITVVPNPSSGMMKIEAKNARKINVEIFDLLGNTLAKLNGISSIEWNGRNILDGEVPSGAYTLSVTGVDQSGNPFRASRQLVIQK